MCIDYAGAEVFLFPCHGSKGNQLWIYKAEVSPSISARYEPALYPNFRLVRAPIFQISIIPNEFVRKLPENEIRVTRGPPVFTFTVADA